MAKWTHWVYHEVEQLFQGKDAQSSALYGSVLETTFTLVFLSCMAMRTCNPWYLFVGGIKAACLDLKEDIRAVKAWPPKWDLQLNLTKYQSPTSGRERVRSVMGDTIDASQGRDLGVTASSFRPFKLCTSAKSKRSFSGSGQRYPAGNPKCLVPCTWLSWDGIRKRVQMN